MPGLPSLTHLRARLTKPLPVGLHTALLVAAIVLAYWWLNVPSLVPYSTQAFAACVIAYFAIKRLTSAKLWHLIPGYLSLEMVIATFALLLLIGATGNLNSSFYPLTYVHLFLLVFSSDQRTSLLTAALMMLFHYGLGPDQVMANWTSLATIPLILTFYIFARSQYQEVNRSREEAQVSEAHLVELEEDSRQLSSFLEDFVGHKLRGLKGLTDHAAQNQKAIQGQLSLMEVEIEGLLSRLRLKERERERARDDSPESAREPV